MVCRGQAFIPLLGADRSLEGPPGRIIQISSTMAQMNVPFGGAYGTSKSAMETLSHFLRAELQVYGIDVIIVGNPTASAWIPCLS